MEEKINKYIESIMQPKKIEKNYASNDKSSLLDDPNLAKLRYETEHLQAYIKYESARREANRINSEKYLRDELQTLKDNLDSRFISEHEMFPTKSDISSDDIPEELKDIVIYIAGRTGWNYLPVLLLILFSISSATRGKYVGKINDAWSEAIVIYGLICAESGNMKSNVLKMVMQPHYLFEDKKQNEHADHLSNPANKASRQLARNIARKQSQKKHCENLKINKESLQEFAERIQHDYETIDAYYNIDEISALPVLFTENSSFPKLYETMQNNGGGTTFASAEGNTFLHLVFASRSPLDIFTKAYNYEKFITETKRDGTKSFKNPFFNIGLMINPDIARQLYSNKRLGLHGLTPRFAVCFGGKYHKIVEDAPGKTDYNKYIEHIKDLLQSSYTQEARRELVEIDFSQEAILELNDIQEHFEIRQKEVSKNQEHYHAYIRKLHGLVARIATILHIWRHQQPEKESVSRKDVIVADKIVRQLNTHAEYAFSPSGLSAYYDAQKIIDWITRHRHSFFTSTDVAKGIENMKNENIFPALDALEKLNIIRQHIEPQKARLCVVHKDFLMKSLISSLLP